MAGNRLNKIDIHNDHDYTLNLFPNDTKFDKWFPPVHRDIDNFRRVLNNINELGGLDFEFPTLGPSAYRATIVGIASDTECAAVEATPALVSEVYHTFLTKRAKMVGHSVIGAEKRVIQTTCGIVTDISEYEDSMLSHYLLNADLAKSPDKGEADDAGALGFMGLWTTAAMTLPWPQWKSCRQGDCEHIICPSHDVKGYCAVDAAASLYAYKEHRKGFRKWSIPDKLYAELKEQTWIAEQMQAKGIQINMAFVNELESKATQYKEQLFKDKGLFNPRANQQVLEWFYAKGVQLASNTKKDIQKALEKEGNKYGYELRDEDGKFDLDVLATAADLPPTLDALYRQYEYKVAGKGLDPWFNEKYRDTNDLVHPRWITIGASTSRWSSSRPNFTNTPARGFGAMVRGAIVPRDESLDLVYADASNLETRVCTYLGGVDPAILGKDPFTWLVQQSAGALEKVATVIGWEPRQLAKSISHGCLTAEHEYLTKDGWKKINEYSGEEIAEYSESGDIDFKKPIKYHEYDFDGELHKLDGRGLSTVCTPNHEWLVNISGHDSKYDKDYSNDYRQRTDNLSISGRIPINGIYNNDIQIPSISTREIEIRKAVAIQADGSINPKYPYYIKFHIVKERKQKRLEALFGIVGTPCKCKKHKGMYYNVRFTSPLLETNPKSFSWKILELSPTERKWFLDEIPYWDEDDSNAKYYFTNVKKCALIVQTVAHITGKQCLFRPYIDKRYGNEKYKLSFNNRKLAAVSSLDHTTIRSKCKVYCFTTSTGYFLARYNDRIFVTGNSNYGEGIKILYSRDLERPHIKSEISYGALRVYKDWEYCGGVVAFTGANLAERLFGDKSRENRKRALEILEDIYFKQMSFIRDWQKKVLREVEDRKYIQYPTGHFLRLYDTPGENAKKALAAYGQGVGAHHMHGILLRYSRETSTLPIMFVHDSFTFEVPRDWSVDRKREFIALMGEETGRNAGFKTPYKAFHGRIGLEYDAGKPETHLPGALVRL